MGEIVDLTRPCSVCSHTYLDHEMAGYGCMIEVGKVLRGYSAAKLAVWEMVYCPCKAYKTTETSEVETITSLPSSEPS